jgi:phosphosulfolactate synthase
MPSNTLIKNPPVSGIPLAGHITTVEYLHRIGVPQLPPCTAPFDPGYDSFTVEGHLDQSANLMEILKISMSCWIITDENVARRKVAAAAVHSVPTVTAGTLFQIAVAQGQLESYLDLCADFGVARVECAESLADERIRPSQIARMAHSRGLELQFELGRHTGTGESVQHVIDQGDRWLNAGALQLATEPRETERDAGVFDAKGRFNPSVADRLARAFGLETVTFAAPDPPAQFAILGHFGRDVHLCNVRLEDLLNVESFRRGLHSVAFLSERLHPARVEPGKRLRG